MSPVTSSSPWNRGLENTNSENSLTQPTRISNPPTANPTFSFETSRHSSNPQTQPQTQPQTITTPRPFRTEFTTPRTFSNEFTTPRTFRTEFTTPRTFRTELTTPRAFINEFTNPRTFRTEFTTTTESPKPPKTTTEFPLNDQPIISETIPRFQPEISRPSFTRPDFPTTFTPSNRINPNLNRVPEMPDFPEESESSFRSPSLRNLIPNSNREPRRIEDNKPSSRLTNDKLDKLNKTITRECMECICYVSFN